MKRIRMLFVMVGLVVAAPVALQAQSPFSIEAQAGVVVPTGDFADDFATTGFGFGVNAAYRVIPMLDIYAAYSWQRFGADDNEFEGVDIDDSGFAFGGIVWFPGTSIDPWIRAGVILHELKLSGSEGSLSASFTSDRSVGFEAGAGLAFPVAPRISLTPGVSFRTHKPEFDLMGETFEETVTYFGVHIGGRIAF